MRNVYKVDNVVATNIKKAFANVPKLLLTATPLQNSLLELYGLVSIIDDDFFGSFESFKDEYVTSSAGSRTASSKLKQLRQRLQYISNRSLRSNVQEYINYTNRQSFTQSFTPTSQEIQLYDSVTSYLNRDKLFAFTSSQRALTSLIMLKLLGSSAYAIASTLERLANRVESEADEGIRRDARGQKFIYQTLDEDLEASLSEEVEDEVNGAGISTADTKDVFTYPLTPEEIKAMRSEADELRTMAQLARNIEHESKGQALIQALDHGFEELPKLNAQRKAIIFTESTRTQEFLYKLLSQNGYEDKIVLFNGSGGGDKGAEIYAAWKEKHQGTDRISGVVTADRRAAIVDYFRDSAEIMIATEAAGEGINLQFCSMVINYDLPWNPQRVEQRIGRCHRYGQKSDVIVINFLNEHNRAEQRILELLSEKFQLFSGVFGASDQVLGAIESGFDFERKIAEIVRTCRTSEQIEESFNRLQDELSEKIDKKMKDTRKLLLDNFDSEVAEKLRVSRDQSEQYLNRYQHMLWQLSKYMLGDKAEFSDQHHSFTLHHSPNQEVEPGTYYLGQKEMEGFKLRLAHPLSQHLIAQAKNLDTPSAHLQFNYHDSPTKTKALEEFLGKAGTLTLVRYARESKVQTEEHYLTLAITKSGKQLPSELATRLLDLPATVVDSHNHEPASLDKQINKEIAKLQKDTKQRDAMYLREEGVKLDGWAADMRRSARMKIAKLDKEIRELKRKIRQAQDVELELKLRQRLRQVEKSRDSHELEYRHKIRDIETKTDELLDTIEASLQAKESVDNIFNITWQLA